MKKRRHPIEIGMRFGRLEIIDTRMNGRRGLQCLCRCDCKTEKWISAHDLCRENGGTKSCGCLKKERSPDLTGKTFGFLYVIARVGVDERNNSMFLCRCLLCDTEKPVPANVLKQGNVISCGCYRHTEQGQEKDDKTRKKGIKYALHKGVNYNSISMLRATRSSATGVRGVFWHPPTKAYQYCVTVQGERKAAFGFKTVEAAKKERDNALIELLVKKNLPIPQTYATDESLPIYRGEERALMKEMYDAGATDDKIAERVGLSVRVIQRWRSENKLPINSAVKKRNEDKGLVRTRVKLESPGKNWRCGYAEWMAGELVVHLGKDTFGPEELGYTVVTADKSLASSLEEAGYSVRVSNPQAKYAQKRRDAGESKHLSVGLSPEEHAAFIDKCKERGITPHAMLKARVESVIKGE